MLICMNRDFQRADNELTELHDSQVQINREVLGYKSYERKVG